MQINDKHLSVTAARGTEKHGLENEHLRKRLMLMLFARTVYQAFLLLKRLKGKSMFSLHNENYEASHKELDANIPASVAAIFTANYKKPKGDNWNKYRSMRNQVQRYEEWKAKGGEGEMNSW